MAAISTSSIKILTTGGSWSLETNLLFSLISHQPYIDKIYLYAKIHMKQKHQFLVYERENTFIDCMIADVLNN